MEILAAGPISPSPSHHLPQKDHNTLSRLLSGILCLAYFPSLSKNTCNWDQPEDGGGGRGGILICRGRGWLVGLFGATSSLPRAKPGEEKPCPSTHAHHVKSLGSGLPGTLEGLVAKRFCANTCSSNETHIPWHQRVKFHYGKHFCNGNQGKGCTSLLILQFF